MLIGQQKQAVISSGNVASRTCAGVQRSEEAAAQFKKWLKALSDHSRNLLGAKAALAAAEATAKV